MTKSDRASLSVCEKSMAIMLNILKISTISLSHVSVKQLGGGVHSHGKGISPGFDLSLSSTLPIHASLKPSIEFAPAYLIEPEKEKKPRAVHVFKPTPRGDDVNQRSSEYIQKMRRRILSDETECTAVDYNTTRRSAMRYPASYPKAGSK